MKLSKTDLSQLERWILALRSGKYKQGKNELYNPKKDVYCCLGVLCKVNKTPVLNDAGNTVGVPAQIRTSTKFASNVNGLFAETEIIVGAGTNNTLTHLNDNMHASFDEIADLLELTFIHKVMEN